MLQKQLHKGCFVSTQSLQYLLAHLLVGHIQTV